MIRTTLRGLASVVLTAVALAAVPAQAQFTIASPTTDWVVVPYPASTTTDSHLDQQTGSAEADIVGGGTLPSFYTKLVPGSGNTDGTLFFRVRLGGDDSPAGYKAACFLGVDANSDGKLDLFFGVNNSGNPNGIYIWKAGTGANISPSTTSIGSQNPVKTYTLTSANYLWTPVTAVIDPAANTPALRNLDGRTSGDTTDYFVNFSLPFADIVAAFQAAGITVNTGTTMNYVVGTATQANAFNQDLNGVNGGTSSSDTWASLGALSLPLNSTGSKILTPPVITSALTASGPAGSAFTNQVVATYSPTIYGANGLPSGLSINPATGTISGTPTVPGTYEVSITATNADGTGAATLTITVTKFTQTISFPVPAATTYGEGTVTLGATASSGLPINYTLTSGAGSVQGNQLTPTGAGTIVVRADQSGNSIYQAAVGVQQSVIVAKAPLAVTAANKSRIFGDANPPLGFAYSGFVNGENLATSLVTGSPTLATTAVASSSTGAYPITVTIGSLVSQNYSFNLVPGVLTVTPAGQALTFPALESVTYGSVPQTPGATSTSGLPVTYSVVSGPATVHAGTVVITGAGDIVIRAMQSGNGNYNAATPVDRSFTAAKATATVTAMSASRIMGEANPAFSVTYSGFVNGETLQTSGIVGSPLIASTADHSSPAGSYLITATLGTLTSANYDFAFAPGILTVGVASQLIDFSDILDAEYGTAPISLAATATSGLPVSYTMVSGPAKIVEGALVIVGAGEVIVKANQPGNANYSAAPEVEQSFTVAKATLTVTATDKSRDFGAANPELNSTFSGFVNGETIQTSGVTGAPALATTATSQSGVGAYPITIAVGTLRAANYKFVLIPGTLTVGAIGQSISFAPIPAAKYGDTVVNLSASATSGLPVQFTLISGPGTVDDSELTITGAGEIVIRAEQSGDGNHEPALAVNQTLIVSKATLTVTGTNVNRAFGEANPPFTATYSGFAKGETLQTSGVTGSPIVTSPADSSSPMGSYPIIVALGTLASANYDFAFAPGVLIVGAASQLIDFSDIFDAEYGTAPIALSATATSGLPVSYAVVSGPATIVEGALVIVGAGEVIVKANQPGNANYSAAPEVEQSFTVAKATLTVTATDKSRDFSAANPEFTSSFSGFVNGETIQTSGMTGASALATTATSQSAVGAYPITIAVGTLSAANYKFVLIPGTLTVNAIGQSISFSPIPASRYGDSAVTLSASATSGLPVQFTVISGPGTVDGGELTINGAGEIMLRAEQPGDGNHEPPLAVIQTLIVSKATLTITAADRARAVGEANPSFSGDYSGFVNGETLATSGMIGAPAFTTTATSASKAGTYAIAAALGNLSAANYDFAFVEGRLVIGAGVQVIDFPAPAAVTYGAGSIEVQATASSGLPVSYVVVSGPGTISANVLTITGAGEIILRAAQPGDEDYTAAPDVVRALQVSKAVLTVTAADVQQVTGGTIPALTASFTGFVNGETLPTSGVAGAPMLTTDASSSNAAGEYPIQIALGTLASSNYSFDLVHGTLTISYVNQAPRFTITSRPQVDEDSGPQSMSGVITDVDPGAVSESSQGLTFEVSTNHPTLFAVQPTIAPDGTLSFTPAPNAHGVSILTVTLRDDGGTANGGRDSSGTQTFELEIASVNDAPVAAMDLAATTGSHPVTINVLANDSDADGEAVLFVGATLTSGQGTVEVDELGQVTLTPAAGFRGPALIVYTIKDAAGLEAVGQLQVTVNAAPLAIADVTATGKDQSILIAVLANDSDADGDPLTISAIALAPGFGTAVVNQPGSGIVFTPAAGLIGTVQFSYTIVDGRGGRSEATVTVEVGTPVPDLPPIVRSDSATTTPGVLVRIPVTENDTDPEGGTLAISSATVDPLQGSITIRDGVLEFVPANGYTGTVIVTYVAVDTAGNTAEGTVTVDVTAPPAAPIAVDDKGRAESGVPKDFSVLLNDLAFDGSSVTLKEAALATGSNGSVSKNADGTIRFRSSDGFQGLVEILYTIEDASGQQAQAKLTVEVFVVLENSTPIAVNDTAHTLPGVPVTIEPLANDSDPDGESLVIKAVSVIEGKGTVVVTDTNGVIFTPAQGFTGVVTLGYQISDPAGAEGSAQIQIIVNIPPVAGADSQRAGTGKTITINVLGNDTDADGHLVHVAAFTGDPTAGDFTISANGNLVFTPRAGFSGPTLLTYTLEDSLGAVVEGQVTITVNDAPIAVSDIAATRIDTAVAVNVLGNDSDPNGDIIRIVAATVDAAQGTVTIESDGTLLFVPSSTFGRTAVIHYLISDTYDETSGAELTINRENTSPEVASRKVYGFCDVPLSINTLRGASDLEGDSLRVVSVSQPSRGKVSIGADGYVTYIPSKAFNNPKLTDSFVVTIEDGTGGVSSMTVEVAAFNSLKGTYQSLITTTEAANRIGGEDEAPIAGNVALKLANGATFTGALQLGTDRYPFSGRLTGALQFEKALKISGYPDAKLRIRFQPERKTFSAEVSGVGSTLVSPNGLQRASKGPTFTGLFQTATFVSRESSSAAQVGWSLRVNHKGRAVYRGVLSDGRVAIGGAHIFSTGEMPLYRAFRSTALENRGYIAGTLDLQNASEHGVLTGSVQEHFQTSRLTVLAPAE